DEEKSLVTRRTASQQAEPADSVIELHSLGLSENPLDLFQHLIRPLQRSRGGKLDVKERVAIILFRQEAGWQPPSNEGVHGREERDNQHTHHSLADQRVAPVDVTARRFREHTVEDSEESREDAFGLFPGPQQQRGERGRESQRVEGRDENGDRN